MFADAIETAGNFTRPLVLSTRSADGTVSCSIGAYMVLNAEGWALTAGHMMDALRAADPSNRKPDDPSAITNVSYWWGVDGLGMGEVHVDFDRDLAITQLTGFESSSVAAYPVFGQPAGSLRPGDSLCRLGYPLHQAAATFDEKTSGFTLAPGTIPIPRFPVDGIYTRDAIRENSATKRKVRFLETSSPGLRGQSGGPIFDTSARVWAIQSLTTHIPLGFSPEVIAADGSKTTEHQFINLGLGCHVDEVLAFVRSKGVSVATSG
jgi:hypothetical protein